MNRIFKFSSISRLIDRTDNLSRRRVTIQRFSSKFLPPDLCDPKYFLQDLSLRSNVRFSLEIRLDPRISRPFYGGDLNNFEIFPQARRGNPLTCKTTLPLGLPRRLLVPRQRSDFFPAVLQPSKRLHPLVHLPILFRRRNAIDRTTNAGCTLSPWKPACKFAPSPSWKRRARALITSSAQSFQSRLF